MFFPIGDDQVHQGHRPIFSWLFIAINVAVFAYQFSLGPEVGQAFVLDFGCIPAEIEAGQDYYTLLTSMFLHGGWMHLIGNMVYMYIFSDNIEASIGSAPFVIFYLLGGLAAGLCHIYFNAGSPIPAVGASGALSAVMGAYIVMFPRSNIKGFLFFFRISVPAFLFLGFWFYQQSSAGYASMGDTSGGIAWWAHIGGFVFGVVAGFLFRTWYGVPGLRAKTRAARR
ncbi:rhomboid family intramembrane serine protease [Neolewinella antarctica]|uniref:Membrane associated rhomboid family serine protease n=1 Tax=Neolewinella antarctica TaxID=442734 RepID=A0ABX0XED3_9BACT|nr:rhomboid family intramembrane serine protease [Neolewinella antarctica]NJC27153.1 membrane associated rhomboid family serine protease [Neolewinella antarctica]